MEFIIAIVVACAFGFCWLEARANRQAVEAYRKLAWEWCERACDAEARTCCACATAGERETP